VQALLLSPKITGDIAIDGWRRITGRSGDAQGRDNPIIQEERERQETMKDIQKLNASLLSGSIPV